MAPNDVESQETLERVKKLESRLGWLQLATFALAGLVVALGIMLFLSPQPRSDVLSARALMLKDSGGGTRAVFGVGSGGNASLTLTDAAAGTRAALSLGADGSPSLTLVGRDGCEAILGTAQLRSAGEWPGEKRIDRRPAASLVLIDRAQNSVWTAP